MPKLKSSSPDQVLSVDLAPGQAGADETLSFGRASRRAPIGLWLAVGWLSVIVLAAILAPVLPLIDPARPDFLDARCLPSLEHPLGCDYLGRDLLSRVISGSRVSLLAGLSSVVSGAIIGGAIGLLAGYIGGLFERAVTIVTDTILAFPGLVFVITIVAVFGASLLKLIAALCLLAVPYFVRLSRANTLVFKQREFVFAARAYGAGPLRLMLREIMPNVALPVAAYGFVMVGIFIVLEGSLSFLGLGIPPPTPSWGSMIAGGRPDLLTHPHESMIPAGVMFFTVLSINYVGERVRERTEGRESNL